MYSKEEVSQLKQAFWAAFGQYIALHPSIEGIKVNWLNYNTGIKNIYFRMRADKRKASIGIDITHPDIEIQELFFEQFTALRKVLGVCMKEDWEWMLHTSDENGKIISRIFKEIHNVNIVNQDDWSTLISFFKPRLIALDEFWSDAKYSFDSLR